MTRRSLPYPLLIVPGLGGSEPEHWQSLWIETFSPAKRVTQLDWDRPNFFLWLHQLRARVESNPGSVLVGHSLGSILIAHLAQSYPALKIAGAVFVAPADVDNCASFPDCVDRFRPIPRKPLPFPSVVIASRDDPYITLPRARSLAEAWRARFCDVGLCGHINVAAGFGPWREGEGILLELLETIRARARGPLRLSRYRRPQRQRRRAPPHTIAASLNGLPGIEPPIS